jgi:hypothetical protein
VPVFFIANEMIMAKIRSETGKTYESTMEFNGKNLEIRIAGKKTFKVI